MKVFVFGGTGMLGSMLVEFLSLKGHDVTFTTRSNKLPKWFPLKAKLSVVDFSANDQVPDLTGYDWVINCIGIIKQKPAPTADYYTVNALLPWKIALACQKANVKMIQISTDCVFDGKSTVPYLTDNQPNATDDYGKSKAFGECLTPGVVVLRTSIIGPSESKEGLLEWFLNQPTDARLNGYTNHEWSGVTTLFLSEFVETVIATNQELPVDRGVVFQIASPPISKYELLCVFNKLYMKQHQIDKVEASERVYRVLAPTNNKLAPSIEDQLVLLRNWTSLMSNKKHLYNK